jgi:hypothetical protein
VILGKKSATDAVRVSQVCVSCLIEIGEERMKKKKVSNNKNTPQQT